MASRPREHLRLEKELSNLQKQREEKCDGDEHDVYAEMWGDDIHHWRGQIKGPMGSPYEGGKFTLEIKIPSDYPYNPPKISFVTKIWHPNISSQTGAICLDILKQEWSPALSIRTALLSIQAMLSEPVPTDPQDAEVAKMLIEDPELFQKTARLWTETFARNGDESQEDKVRKLAEMGFDADAARVALLKHNWDETSALNSLLG